MIRKSRSRTATLFTACTDPLCRNLSVNLSAFSLKFSRPLAFFCEVRWIPRKPINPPAVYSDNVVEMRPNSKNISVAVLSIVVIAAFFPGVVISNVSAADAYYEGYLGDVIDLHGVSYTGSQVYLFLTGPNLPANGVTLTDTSQRADQGHFTIVTLDSNQKWSMKWDTQRLKTQIDPGTYTVYVTTDPVDLSQLGGTNTYKTLEVYLADTHAPQGESGPGTYTLNPEQHTSMVIPTIIMGTPNATQVTTPVNQSPVPTTLPSTMMTTATAETSQATSPTQAGIPIALPILAALFGLVLALRKH